MRHKLIVGAALIALCGGLIGFAYLKWSPWKVGHASDESLSDSQQRATHGLVLTRIHVKMPPSNQLLQIKKLQISSVVRPTTSESYANLEKSARSGNGQSAYVLFRLFQTCKSLMSRPKLVTAQAADFDATWCEQVQSTNFDYMSWLRSAIKDGYVPAALAAYREDLPDVCQSGANGAAATTQTVFSSCELLDHALQAAIKEGSLNAVVAVGARAVWNGPPDEATMTSYAYIYAASEGLKTSAARDIDVDNADSGSYQSLLDSESAKYDKWMNQLSANLTPTQLGQAQKMGLSVLSGMSSCCQLYPRDLPQ